MHQPESVIVNKTYLEGKDRASVCPLCPNNIQVKEVPFSHSDNDLFVKTSYPFIILIMIYLCKLRVTKILVRLQKIESFYA